MQLCGVDVFGGSSHLRERTQPSPRDRAGQPRREHHTCEHQRAEQPREAHHELAVFRAVLRDLHTPAGLIGSGEQQPLAVRTPFARALDTRTIERRGGRERGHPRRLRHHAARGGFHPHEKQGCFTGADFHQVSRRIAAAQLAPQLAHALAQETRVLLVSVSRQCEPDHRHRTGEQQRSNEREQRREPPRDAPRAQCVSAGR